GFDATDCPVEIQVKRHSQYKINVGNPLIIACPVHYCKQQPDMQWCKIEVATCVQLKEAKTKWESNVFTLEIFSVHQNDSGVYRCRATVDNLSSESHGIRVTVEGEAPILRKSPFKQKDAMYRKAHACRTMASPNHSTAVLVCTTFFMLLSCLLV
ncbi:BTLA protein, partial [Herpetotheres cachinnans]|nr:BTLA protein [Herpetotheres cachinnans]